MTKTKKTNNVIWQSAGKSASGNSKNKLIEMLIESSELYETASVFNCWITKENINSGYIFKTFSNIKKIQSNIVVYYRTKNDLINEIIISSSPYTKEIYEQIVCLFMDLEDKTGREYNYYYVASEKITDSLLENFSVYQ